MKLPVYLDYNATTPVDPQVAGAIEPYLREHFGNPSSDHVYGRRAKKAVIRARQEVAALIGAIPEEMIFTGCATEANNLAIQGIARALWPRKRHLITSAVEHPSVMQPFLRLRDEGWSVTILPVDGDGRVEPAAVAKNLHDDTALISVMHANNETGAIQPIAEIAAIAQLHDILLHTDAAQSVGKITVNVDSLKVDLLTLAGHKFYATKGVGALYIRQGTPCLLPITVGASHEWGMRPGTENVPALVGMGAAARLVPEQLASEAPRIAILRDRLYQQLRQSIPGLALNGPPSDRLPNTLNISFPGVNGRDLLEAAASDIAASVGSACHTEKGGAADGVLTAMALPAERIAGAVRLSLGTPTTNADIDHAARALAAAWKSLSK